MKVKPVLTSKATSTNGFTPGKEYEVIDKISGVLIVVNDNGHERYIIPDCQSPHLVFDNGKPGIFNKQECVGYFEVVE